MPARKSWGQLSKATQARYIGAYRSGKATGTAHPGTDAQLRAEVRKLHKASSLQGARGHATWVEGPKGEKRQVLTSRSDLARKTGRRPPSRQTILRHAQIVARAQASELDDRDLAALKRWRAGPQRPRWVPKSTEVFSDATAAIIASIGIPPSRWRDVHFVVLEDGATKMIVEPTRGYPVEVILPDPSMLADVGRWIHTLRATGLEVLADGVGYASPGPRGRIAA